MLFRLAIAACVFVACTPAGAPDACGGLAPEACVEHARAIQEQDPMRQHDAWVHALYDAACLTGHAPGCLASATWLSEGHPTPYPFLAIDRFTKACVGGEGQACWSAGSARLQVEGALPDLAAAAADFDAGCRLDHAQSCVDLGLMMLAGQGVEQHPSMAYERFQHACDLGDPRGCTQVGLALRDGKGVDADGEAGLLTLEAACDEAYAPACGLGAITLDEGVAVSKDPARRLALLMKGTALLDPVAVSTLAEELPPNHAAREAALTTLTERCTAASPLPCRLAATLTSSPTDAEPWLRTGCTGADHESCGLLGVLIDKGHLTARTGDPVSLWLDKGCRARQPLACWTLASQQLPDVEQTWNGSRHVRSALRVACRGGVADACVAWRDLIDKTAPASMANPDVEKPPSPQRTWLDPALDPPTRAP